MAETTINGFKFEGDDTIFRMQAAALMEDMLNKLWPVGCYYRTSVADSHPEIGTWELVEGGKFFVSAGTGYEAGTTGGSDVLRNVPTHKHSFTVSGSTKTDGEHTHRFALEFVEVSKGTSSSTMNRVTPAPNQGGTQAASSYETLTGYNAELHKHAISISGDTDNTGSDSVSIMPPYIAAYTWHRIA